VILVPTLHPSFLARSSDDAGAGMAKFGEAVVDDLRKACRLTTTLPTWNESAIWDKDAAGRLWRLFPTVAEVVAFVQAAHENAARGGVVVADVETSGESPLACKLLCVGLGLVMPDGRAGQMLCVPFMRKGALPYWSAEDDWRVRGLLAQMFAVCASCFHNGPFDTTVLGGHGMPCGNYSHDTMTAQHCIDAELPAGLAYVASRFTDGRYWKDDVKGDIAWVDMDDTTLRSYNLRDILSTSEILPQIEREVVRLGLWPLYQEELELSRYFARATWRGMAVDEDRRKALGAKLRAQRDSGIALLRSVAGAHGATFDPAKPTHLRYLLYDLLKFPKVKISPKSGLASTDKDAMVLLALMADKPEQIAAIKGLIDFRTGEKMLGTWVEGLPILADGRVHASWKLLTTTGRFASSPNMQNLPIAIKKMFCAARPGSNQRDGWKYVGVDLSQAELRYIGYDANDPYLLDQYAHGINVHTVNCGLFFKVRPPAGHKDMDPATEAYLRARVTELFPGESFDDFPQMTAARWKPTRVLAKNAEFGSNYLAEDETVYRVLRAKRDPDTNELLFPDIELSEVSAVLAVKKKIRPALVAWWRESQIETQRQGFHRCPISGRMRWFRAGFKSTEVVNTRIQMGVASHVNRRTVRIARRLDAQFGGAAQVVSQVHDALNVECPDEITKEVGRVLVEELSAPFALRDFPAARLPADGFDVGQYLNEV
jgi:DNA polymerase I-like protein with 3'-5' exonuclease and polymerase domains